MFGFSCMKNYINYTFFVHQLIKNELTNVKFKFPPPPALPCVIMASVNGLAALQNKKKNSCINPDFTF